ncbi:NeuD/PglB/VioB family sugar acetyltransferase [Chloroflexota bacterium]
MKIIVIGAGAQANIVHEILSYDRNIEVVAFVDYLVRCGKETIKGIPILGDHDVIPDYIKSGIKGAIIAISMNDIRQAHFEKIRAMGLEMMNAIHPTASIATSARLGSGITIAMGAIICTGVNINDNVIVSTGSIIDHEDEIGENVYLGTGCSLAGRVTVKKNAHIGIGTVIRENLTIGTNSVISAGSVVLDDVPDNVIASGTPAKFVEKR